MFIWVDRYTHTSRGSDRAGIIVTMDGWMDGDWPIVLIIPIPVPSNPLDKYSHPAGIPHESLDPQDSQKMSASHVHMVLLLTSLFV